jgi:urease accessory protein
VAGDRVKSRNRSRASVVVAALLLPTAAHAHLVTTGLGPFYDGMSHFLLTPEDLLPALALALLAGLRGAHTGRLALFALPAAWLAGGLIGLAFPAMGLPPVLATLWFVVLGGLVAADARLSPTWLTAIAVALGLLQGAANGAAMSEARLGALGLVGIAATLFVAVALAAALVVALRAPWSRIAVRVAGSWIVATGLLVLGWSLRA